MNITINDRVFKLEAFEYWNGWKARATEVDSDGTEHQWMLPDFGEATPTNAYGVAASYLVRQIHAESWQAAHTKEVASAN